MSTINNEKVTLTIRIRQLLESKSDMTSDEIVGVLKKEKYVEEKSGCFKTKIRNVRSYLKKKNTKNSTTAIKSVDAEVSNNNSVPPIAEIEIKKPNDVLELVAKVNTLASKVGSIGEFKKIVDYIGKIDVNLIADINTLCNQEGLGQITEIVVLLEKLAATGIK